MSNQANIIRHIPTLEQIVMPLIGMLAEDGISWNDRATISKAIQACQRHWRQMEAERQNLNQQQAGQQQGTDALKAGEINSLKGVLLREGVANP